MLLILAAIDNIYKNKKYTGTCTIYNYYAGDTIVKNGTTTITPDVGTELVKFTVPLSVAQSSIRYRSKNIGSVNFAVPKGLITVNGKQIAPMAITGVTQSIWGGSNTAYMVHKVLNTDYKTTTNSSGTFLNFDVMTKNLSATKIDGALADSELYKKSLVYSQLNDAADGSKERAWITCPLTPEKTVKYWPVVVGGKKAGPKDGENVIFEISLPVNEGFQGAEFTSQQLVEGLKLIGAEASVTNELTVQEGAKQAVQCSFNAFVTYDIYYETWVVALCSTWIAIAILVAVPLKCFNLGRYLTCCNKKVVKADKEEATVAESNLRDTLSVAESHDNN